MQLRHPLIFVLSLRTIATAFLLCFALVNSAAAEVRSYLLTTCIVSGDKIDPNIQAVVYNGQQVRFCCKACIKKFQACPEKYLVQLQGDEPASNKHADKKDRNNK